MFGARTNLLPTELDLAVADAVWRQRQPDTQTVIAACQQLLAGLSLI